jgi:hypothetical protein
MHVRDLAGTGLEDGLESVKKTHQVADVGMGASRATVAGLGNEILPNSDEPEFGWYTVRL